LLETINIFKKKFIIFKEKVGLIDFEFGKKFQSIEAEG